MLPYSHRRNVNYWIACVSLATYMAFQLLGRACVCMAKRAGGCAPVHFFSLRVCAGCGLFRRTRTRIETASRLCCPGSGCRPGLQRETPLLCFPVQIASEMEPAGASPQGGRLGFCTHHPRPTLQFPGRCCSFGEGDCAEGKGSGAGKLLESRENRWIPCLHAVLVLVFCSVPASLLF